MNINENKEKRQGSRGGAVSGAFSLTVSAIIFKIIGLIYKIPLSHLLGGEGMGYFNSAYTVYGLFYILCTAGVPKAITMLVLETKEGHSRFTEKQVVKTAISLFLILGVLFTSVFMIFSGQISAFIGSSKAKTTMLAVAPSILFVSLGGVLRGYLTSEMSFLNVAVSQILDGVGKLVFGLIFAYRAFTLGYSPELVSAFTIFGVTLGAFISFLYMLISSKSQNTSQKTKQKLKIEDKQEIRKRIFGISLPITVSAAVMSIGNIIDLLVVMKRLGAAGYSEQEATALYGHYTTLAVPMLNFALSVITPVSVAFLPMFINGRVKNDLRLSEESRKNALSLTSFITAPLFFGISAFAKEILTMLFGSEGISTGAPLLVLIMPAAVFMSVLLIVNTTLEAEGSVRAPILSMLIGSVLKVFISYFLISDSDVGISAAPIGTVVSYAVALSVSLGVAYKKHGIRFPIFKTHMVPYLNAGVTVICAKALYAKVAFGASATLSLLLCALLGGIIYTILSFLSGAISVKKVKNLAVCTKTS